MRVEPRLTILALAAIAIAVAVAFVIHETRGGPRAVATTMTPVTDRAEQRQIGRRALRLVRYPASRLDYRIDFAAGRAGIRAQTDPERRIITVFLRQGDADHVVAHDIGHELGHAYDLTHLDAPLRARYLSARGAAGADWSIASPDDYGTGAGDFAEVFALCHVASPDFRSTLAVRPVDPCRLLPKGAL